MTTRRCGGSLSAACNFDDGDCTDRFVGAGRDALAPCDRGVCSVFDAQAFTLIAWPLDSDTMLLEFINLSLLIIIAPAAATAATGPAPRYSHAQSCSLIELASFLMAASDHQYRAVGRPSPPAATRPASQPPATSPLSSAAPLARPWPPARCLTPSSSPPTPPSPASHSPTPRACAAPSSTPPATELGTVSPAASPGPAAIAAHPAAPTHCRPSVQDRAVSPAVLCCSGPPQPPPHPHPRRGRGRMRPSG